MEGLTKRSVLIILEGPDEVGKSTLAAALTGRLPYLDVPCAHVALPGNSVATLGRLVNRIHQQPADYGLECITSTSLQALHIAAHLDAIERSIRPALAQGHWVVLERSWWSTWVYGTCGGGDPETLEALVAAERRMWAGTKPTVVFLVDRIVSGSDAERSDPIRSGYQALADRERGKYPIVPISNNGSIGEAIDLMIEHLSVAPAGRHEDSATITAPTTRAAMEYPIK